MKIASCASRVAQWKQHWGVVDREMLPVYAYGMELLFSGVINVFLIMVVSIALNCPYAWILFLLAFIPQRITAGGYHSTTHFRCVMLGTTVFTLFLLAIRIIPQQFLPKLIVLVCIVNLGLVLLFSPIQSDHKPLSTERLKKNRHNSIILALISLTSSIVLWVWIPNIVSIFIYYYSGISVAGISLVAGKYIHSGRRKKDDKNS